MRIYFEDEEEGRITIFSGYAIRKTAESLEDMLEDIEAYMIDHNDMNCEYVRGSIEIKEK